MDRTESITICGIGALGGNIAESLSRQGFNNLKIVDMDIIEKRNIHTQPYMEIDIGKSKVKVLAERLYRINKTKVITMNGELTQNSKDFINHIVNSALIIDCFDNPSSRQIVKDISNKFKKDCVHIGISVDYGEVIWDEKYKVPKSVGNNPCDNPDSRELVLMTVALACRTVREYIDKKERNNYGITIKDLKIEKWN